MSVSLEIISNKIQSGEQIESIIIHVVKQSIEKLVYDRIMLVQEVLFVASFL